MAVFLENLNNETIINSPGESIQVQEDICTLALARAFKELRVRFPTCKHVYGCIDVYSTVDLYSSEQQQQPPSKPSSEDDAPSPSPQDGAITLKWWVINRSQKPVDGDDIADDWNKLFAAWKSVIPRNDYDAKELEWCSSHKTREDEATKMGRPLVSSVSQGDGPDGYSPLLVLGSCRLCGKEHEPYTGDVSQEAQAAAGD